MLRGWKSEITRITFTIRTICHRWYQVTQAHRYISWQTYASIIHISKWHRSVQQISCTRITCQHSKCKGKFILVQDNYYHCQTQITIFIKRVHGPWAYTGNRYFIGNTAEQIDQRCWFNTGTKRDIVAALQTLFYQHNELFWLFRAVLEQMPAGSFSKTWMIVSLVIISCIK